jgi:acetate---CoA ligase (ADP-forming)
VKIDRLIKPDSIAVLGASEKPSLGRSMIEALKVIGYAGAIYPINPKYDFVAGLTCYPDLRSIGRPVDAVAFCVGLEASLKGVQELAECGAGAGVIYGSGFAEQGEAGRIIQVEIESILRASNIALCGPNCMGVLNPVHRSSTFFQPVRDPAGLAGHIGLVSQSGSIAASFLADLRRFGFSTVISSGNEAVVDLADYISYLANDPATSVIAAFVESVRRPGAFVAALAEAALQEKPVIILKAGKSERAARQIQSHTGGLAGQGRIFSEVLRAYRAIEVNSLAEMTEQIAVCLGGRRPKGRRIGVVTTSGGQAELVLDMADAYGVPLPPLPEPLRMEVEAGIGSSVGAGNPLDAWGHDGSFLPKAFALFSDQDLADSIVFCGTDCLDTTALGRPGRDLIYAKNVADAAQRSDRPHYYLTARQNIISRAQVELLSAVGVPLIGGTELGLKAIDRYAQWVMEKNKKLRDIPKDMPFSQAYIKILDEYESKSRVNKFGVPIVREHAVPSLEGVLQAAESIGYPVVLKALCHGVAHKSEHGFVHVRIINEEKLRLAYGDLTKSAQLSGKSIDAYLVQEMVSDGIEVFAGVSRDPQFGLTMAFGLGGTAVEILDDISLRLLPLLPGDAETMIAGLRASALFEAFRGRPPLDVDALVKCLYALSDFACAHIDELEELDLNPIFVRPKGLGCVVADAMIVIREG